MAFSLYDAFVIPCRLRLDATADIIDKVKREVGVTDQALLDARLTDDMNPFPFQVKTMVVQSRGAIDSVIAGEFSPDRNPPPQTVPALSAMLRDSSTLLAALSRNEIETLSDKVVRFNGGRTTMEFTGGSFLTRFALPNVNFHATIAYALIRRLGVDIGKRDYLGTATFQQF